MTPFWFIVIGAGVGWLINSGRLEAVINAVLQLPPSSATPSYNTCPAGQHRDSLTGLCMPDPGVPQVPGTPGNCPTGTHLDPIMAVCVPN